MSEAPATTLAPEPTAEHAYTQALTIALLQTLGPKKGQRFLGHLRDVLAGAVERSDVIPIRGDRARLELERAAQIDAARRFAADLPTLLRAAY